MVKVWYASPPILVRLPETAVIAVPPESCLAPTTNLSLKSGVPLLPSHNCQPLGIEATVPDQKMIAPTKRESLSTLPGTGIVLTTTVPDTEAPGKSLATRLVHSWGTTVETVKEPELEEIEYAFCHGLLATQAGFRYPALCRACIPPGQALLAA
jgi:hypothetical protein